MSFVTARARRPMVDGAITKQVQLTAMPDLSGTREEGVWVSLVQLIANRGCAVSCRPESSRPSGPNRRSYVPDSSPTSVPQAKSSTPCRRSGERRCDRADVQHQPPFTTSGQGAAASRAPTGHPCQTLSLRCQLRISTRQQNPRVPPFVASNSGRDAYMEDCFDNSERAAECGSAGGSRCR